jgi:hypothetical protein
MGIRNEKEAMEMAGGVDWELTPEEIQTIEQALADWT